MGSANGGAPLLWDWSLRLFHWLLAVAVAGAYVTAEIVPDPDMHTHMLFGYLVTGLLLYRLMWGLVGTRPARFASFFPTPGRLSAYLKGQGPAVSPGHNALGALSVFALLVALAVQVLAGLFLSDGILASGPLAGLVGGDTSDFARDVHGFNFNILVALIALHVAAILYYRFVKRERLITAMVTGRREGLESAYAIPGNASLRALLVILAAIVATYVLVVYLPDWLGGSGGGNYWD